MARNATSKKSGRGSLPTRKSINFASVGEKKVRYGILIPVIILAVLAVAAFAKFAVIDRLNALETERAELARIEREIAEGYAKIESYGELTERYAHYTFSDMTAEELTRTDRVAIVDLISRVVIPEAVVSSWDVKGNELSLTITGETLQQINLIAQKIEAEEIVDFCTVTTAATQDTWYNRVYENTDNRVTAKIIVYLNEMTPEVVL